MIRGIKFVGIPVRNQDASLAFYTQKLGCKPQINKKSDWALVVSDKVSH